MSAKPADAAASIVDQFPDNVALDPATVEARLRLLVDDYGVPLAEAERATRNHFLDETGLTFEDLALEGEAGRDSDAPRALATITAADEWVTVRAEVVELWEPRSEKIDQVGLLGDASGTLKFTKWASAADALPVLEEGQTYRIESAVTDEYQGRYSVNLNSATEIEPIDADFDVGSQDVAVRGALVAIQDGSGLIKRCSAGDCTRVLRDGRCTEHGDVDGAFDLRLKAVIDDGQGAVDVIFDQDATEALTGMSLADAKDRAMDALDREVVRDELAAQVRGRYYEVRGPVVGQYLLVESSEKLGAAGVADPAELEARIEAVVE